MIKAAPDITKAKEKRVIGFDTDNTASVHVKFDLGGVAGRRRYLVPVWGQSGPKDCTG